MAAWAASERCCWRRGGGAQGHELPQRVRLSQGADRSGVMSGFPGGVQGRFLDTPWAVTALLSVRPSSPSALSSAEAVTVWPWLPWRVPLVPRSGAGGQIRVGKLETQAGGCPDGLSWVQRP